MIQKLLQVRGFTTISKAVEYNWIFQIQQLLNGAIKTRELFRSKAGRNK
jgi:hypothetical protein